MISLFILLSSLTMQTPFPAMESAGVGVATKHCDGQLVDRCFGDDSPSEQSAGLTIELGEPGQFPAVDAASLTRVVPVRTSTVRFHRTFDTRLRAAIPR